MKAFVVSFGLLLGLLCGCSDNEDSDVRVIANISVAIHNTDSYRYVVTLGDEEALTIGTPPSHYEVSTLTRDSNTGNTLYVYTPSKHFVGEENVELVKWTGSDGTSSSVNKEYIRIKIKVGKE